MSASSLVTSEYLVRYGAIPELVYGSWLSDQQLQRGARIVVETARGEEVATVLESKKWATPDQQTSNSSIEILRTVTPEDAVRQKALIARAKQEFSKWSDRIVEWGIDLQLIDLEWTLDESRLVLYVLNDRGPECTKLALQATAAGYGAVDVQPVSLDGLVQLPPEKKGGGCGSGGCGCG